MTKDPWHSCPTRRLLLDYLRQPPLPESAIPTLSSAEAWQQLIQLAERHKITPLLSPSLSNHPAVPAEIATDLKLRQQRNAYRSLQQLAKLGEILTRFDAAKIPVLAIKGPLLATQLFGDPGLRQTGDLDLIVAPDQYERAEALLLAAGYRRQRPAISLAPRQKQTFLKIYNEAAFHHPDQPWIVELHWRWFRNPEFFPYPVETALREAGHSKLGHLSILSLDQENLLLYLCAHGAQHAWYRLKWLVDLPPLVNSDLNISRLLILARQRGSETMLALGLLLARELLKTPLPPALDDFIQSIPGLAKRATYVRDIMAREHWRDSTLPEKLHRLRYLQSLRPHWPYRWWELKGYCYHWEDWQQLPLPDQLFWLYLPLRPLLWLRRRINP